MSVTINELRADGSPSTPEHTQSFSPQSFGAHLILTRAVLATVFCHKSPFFVLAPPERFGTMRAGRALSLSTPVRTRPPSSSSLGASANSAQACRASPQAMREGSFSQGRAAFFAPRNTCLCYHTVFGRSRRGRVGLYDVVGVAFCRDEGCHSQAFGALERVCCRSRLNVCCLRCGILPRPSKSGAQLASARRLPQLAHPSST